jgi:tetratricopeptide (TPR) repeat protein
MSRFVERHAQAALYIIGFVAFLLGLILLDILQVFPDRGRPQAVLVLSALLDVVKSNLTSFRTATQFMAAFATILGATVSIYVGIRYAQKRLPARFLEIMADDAKVLDVTRDRARALIDHQRFDFVSRRTTLYVGPLNAALKSLSLANVAVATKELAEAKFEIEAQIELAQRRLDGLNAQAGTVNVLRGIIALCHRGPEPDDQHLRHARRKRAEACFSHALDFDRNDADALELRAETRLELNREQDARTDFETLIAIDLIENDEPLAIDAQRLLLIQARAHRRLGELEMARARRDGVQNAYQSARTYVDDGIALLTDSDADHTIDHQVELARLYLTAAEIFRRRIPQQPQNFHDAKTRGLRLVNGLTDPTATDVREKLNAIALGEVDEPV